MLPPTALDPHVIATTWTLPEMLTAWVRRRDAKRAAEADELYSVLVQAQATVISGHFTDKSQVEKANRLLTQLSDQITRLRRPEIAPQRATLTKGEAVWLAAGTSMETIRRHYRIDGEDA